MGIWSSKHPVLPYAVVPSGRPGKSKITPVPITPDLDDLSYPSPSTLERYFPSRFF